MPAPILNKLRAPGARYAVATGIILALFVGYVILPPSTDVTDRLVRGWLLVMAGALAGLVAHELFARVWRRFQSKHH